MVGYIENSTIYMCSNTG
ncbi:MAG: hypothetical protein II734_05180, partial [Paludibacteraceae bacterium]|nr:hypothetical protein [Paludibacteraceae bacterium]